MRANGDVRAHQDLEGGEKGGRARHQALSRKTTMILSYLNDWVSKGTVIPTGAVKGDSNMLQFRQRHFGSFRPFVFH